MRASIHPRTRAALAALLAAAGAAACADLLAPPAAVPARLSVSWALDPGAPALQTGAGRAFDRADHAHLWVSRGDALVLADSFDISPAGTGGVIRRALELKLERAEEELEVAVQLHWQGHHLFTGASTVRLARGRQDSAAVELLPVPATVSIAAVPVVEAIGDTVPLSGAVLFATGDTIPGAALEWSTPDSAVATLIPGGRLVARAEGTARVVASAGGARAERTVVVRARVASVGVTPGTASIFVGDSLRLVATPRDRRGNALAGRPAVWVTNAASIATVTPAGTVWAGGPGAATVTATVEGQSGAATLSVAHPGSIHGMVRDRQTLAPIAGATLQLTGPAAGQTRTVQPTAQGAYLFAGLRPGNYTLAAAAPGHGGNTAALRLLHLPAGDVVQVVFDLPATAASQQVAGVAGRVTSPQGAPIAGATVMISGGTLTNGVFKSVVTGADGTYSLAGIGLTASGGQVIPSFSVTAAGNGLATQRRDTLALVAGQTRANVDFAMVPGPPVQTYFADGFEGALAWQVTGFWNRTTGANVVNTAVPGQADLAPDDHSAARLPAAPQGTQYLWYGVASTGNFLGSGSNSGTATSPVFVIPAGTAAASLTFRTWFEIESVNPNASGYDIMSVAVVDVAAGTTHQLTRLNPFADPDVANRSRIPFTSGGFNRAPVFRPVTLDLTPYAGKQIRIRFSFATVDGLYNYFRGWIVDDVQVTSEPAAALLQAGASGPAGAATATGRCTRRCDRRP